MQGRVLIQAIKHIIPVASGKGGVGKSTVSANLALALLQTGARAGTLHAGDRAGRIRSGEEVSAAAGLPTEEVPPRQGGAAARVGLMDADVYGPSIPTLLGITQSPELTEQRRIIPVEQHGLKVISMGFFMKPEEAVIWRGPMLHKTIEQFLGTVEWGELDYLLVDTPPGTGDVTLSLCQAIPITGAVIVSTPQDVALNVASRAIAMFRKLNAPILGVVENMSTYTCPHCGTQEQIFGSGGARKTAERLDIPFLGEIPLATAVREQSDAGQPVVLSQPDSPAAKAFKHIAQQLVAQVTARAAEGQTASQIKMTF